VKHRHFGGGKFKKKNSKSGRYSAQDDDIGYLSIGRARQHTHKRDYRAGVGEEGRGGAAHKGAKKRARTATRAQHCQWTSEITIYRKRRRLLKINTILLRQCAARQTFSSASSSTVLP